MWCDYTILNVLTIRMPMLWYTIMCRHVACASSVLWLCGGQTLRTAARLAFKDLPHVFAHDCCAPCGPRSLSSSSQRLLICIIGSSSHRCGFPPCLFLAPNTYPHLSLSAQDRQPHHEPVMKIGANQIPTKLAVRVVFMINKPLFQQTFSSMSLWARVQVLLGWA